MKGYLGAFLHGVAFMVAVVLFGLIGQAIDRKIHGKEFPNTKSVVGIRWSNGIKAGNNAHRKSLRQYVIWHTVLFDVALVFENFLYCVLRAIFIVSKTSPITVTAVFKSTLSIGNPVCVVLLIVAIMMIEGGQQIGD